MTPLPSTTWECDTCRARQPRWTAACLACGEWGVSRAKEGATLLHATEPEGREGRERVAAPAPICRPVANTPPAVPVAIDLVSMPADVARTSTCIPELDRVLGGGIAPAAFIFLAGDPGAGKCLGIGTPVMLADGSVLPVEKIKVGDVLMGPSGHRRVLSTNTGRGELFRIDPVKGDPWVCNDKHVMTIVQSTTDEVHDIQLDRLLVANARFRHWAKLFTVDVVDFSGFGKDLPIDPYFLGVWFGDGTKEIFDGRLRKVAVTKPDPEIAALCEHVASEWGLRVNTFGDARCPTHAIVGAKGLENPLLEAMRALLGPNLEMPPSYVRAPREQRLHFLAGLIDTDGDLMRNCFSITQKREDWAREIWWIARSLGLCATLATRKGRCKRSDGTTFEGDYWRVSISGDVDMIPTRIPRKQAEPRQQKKTATRTGFSVEAIGIGDFYGFTLDGDGRFLLGDFTVTHNSTLLAQVLSSLAATNSQGVLYASGEESLSQIALRARRVGAVSPGLLLVAETDVDRILALCDERRPAILAIDSIQTVRTSELAAPAGTPGQVRECASRIAAFAKATNTPTFLVGHVTKDGEIGGPKTLEHLVDVVLQLEHDEESGLRFLRGNKNRFGSTAELGIFEMRQDGIHGVGDASSRMLAYRDEAATGSAIVPMLDGTRVVLVEIQALVTRTTMAGEDPAGKTVAHGLSAARVQIVRAVLERHTDLSLHGYDIFVQVAGNVRVAEPAADLAVALAIASSRRDRSIAGDVAACGELGLTGEIRGVPMLEERIREAARMGFSRVIARSRRDEGTLEGVAVAKRLADAIDLAIATPGDPAESSPAPPTPAPPDVIWETPPT